MEIKPLVPTWPSRPSDKVRKEKERSEPEQRDEEEKNDEPDKTHIDEYA